MLSESHLVFSVGQVGLCNNVPYYIGSHRLKGVAGRTLSCVCAAVNSADGPPARRHGSPVLKVILQFTQLFLVLSLLLLLPAKLFTGRISSFNWLLYSVYTTFFSVGSLQRILKYGGLASRSSDAQVKTKGRLVGFILFIAAIPAGDYC